MNVLEMEEVSDIISWPRRGHADYNRKQNAGGFVILDKKRIETIIMPKYFNTDGKYSSFSRRLRRWGFRLEGNGRGKSSSCFHPMFIRGRMEICKQMIALPQARSKSMVVREGTSTIIPETPKLTNAFKPPLVGLTPDPSACWDLEGFGGPGSRSTISGRTRRLASPVCVPDISSNASMQRRRMAMAARNAGHLDFTMMPSTIQQNSHPAFAVDNFAYCWPQHQKEALLVMQSRPLMFLQQQQPHGNDRIHGVFSNQQEQRHNVSVQHTINNRCTGGLTPTRMARTARRGSEADKNALALALIELRQEVDYR